MKICITWGGKKTCPSATLSTINSTWTGLELNPADRQVAKLVSMYYMIGKTGPLNSTPLYVITDIMLKQAGTDIMKQNFI